MIGIFPNAQAVIGLIAVLLLDLNDDSAVQRAHYMTWKPSSETRHVGCCKEQYC